MISAFNLNVIPAVRRYFYFTERIILEFSHFEDFKMEKKCKKIMLEEKSIRAFKKFVTKRTLPF